MKRWLRRVRGALGMGLTWGVVGFAVGGVIELIHNIWPNPIGGAVDIWPAVLAYPGFLGGVAFSAVLGIAGRRRGFSELSLPGVAAAGAAGGLIVSLIPAAMTVVGLASPNVPLLELTAWLAPPFMLGGAAAASGSLLLARRADDRALLTASDDLAGLGLTEDESKELLGDG